MSDNLRTIDRRLVIDPKLCEALRLSADQIAQLDLCTLAAVAWARGFSTSVEPVDVKPGRLRGRLTLSLKTGHEFGAANPTDN